MVERKGASVTDLYVSYKAEDRVRVARLVRALESDGLSVWWDVQIGGGDDWRETIQLYLDAAQCVIVVWSKRSVGPQGDFVRDEAGRALRRGVYLPICIDNVAPPLGFGERQALPLHNWKGDRKDARYQAVLQAATARASKLAVNRNGLQVTTISRRAVIAGSAGAAVAATGLGAWYLTGPATAASDSIAVLPFANLSGDPAQAYFSDGLSEELRSSLSRIAKLKVVARTSSEVVRSDDARTAARKLDVANILTGSVRRTPAMIRVSAQLVDGVEGVERWSQTYNRASGDALEIQTDIANMVAEALSIQLGGDERSRLTEGGTNNSAAQDLLLKARATYGHDDSEVSLQRSIGIIDAALALDRNYADALSEKALMLRSQAGTHAKSAAESQSYYALAVRTAKRAIQLAPHVTRGYSALAIILDSQLNRRAAQAQWDKLRSLTGIDGSVLANYAMFLSEIGHRAQAVQVADRAIALDPLNPWSFVVKALTLSYARRYLEAVQAVRQARNLGRNLDFPRALHAYLQMMLGNTAQARAEFASLKSNHGQTLAWESVSAARLGDMIESDRILLRLRTLWGDTVYYQSAQVLAQQGNTDQAIEAVEKAFTARDPGLKSILVDPLLDPLRGDGRFQALVKQLDFPT